MISRRADITVLDEGQMKFLIVNQKIDKSSEPAYDNKKGSRGNLSMSKPLSYVFKGKTANFCFQDIRFVICNYIILVCIYFKGPFQIKN